MEGEVNVLNSVLESTKHQLSDQLGRLLHGVQMTKYVNNLLNHLILFPGRIVEIRFRINIFLKMINAPKIAYFMKSCKSQIVNIFCNSST
jgi:hypothetical protein